MAVNLFISVRIEGEDEGKSGEKNESRADEGDSWGGNSRDVKGLSGLMTYCLKNRP